MGGPLVCFRSVRPLSIVASVTSIALRCVAQCVCGLRIRQVVDSNPHQFNRYSTTSNNMKLVHWLLMGGLLHLVQRSGDGVGLQSTQAPSHCIPNVTAHPSTASVPITVLLYNSPLLRTFNGLKIPAGLPAVGVLRIHFGLLTTSVVPYVYTHYKIR